MSNAFLRELEKLKKKDQGLLSGNTTRQTISPSTSYNDYSNGFINELNRLQVEEEERRKLRTASQIKSSGLSTLRSKKKEEEEDDGRLQFFKSSGVFEDGYDFGDVTKTILGTAGDVGVGVLKGVGGLVEGVGDLLTYKMAADAKTTVDLFGVENKFGERVKEFAQRNLVEEVAKPADDFLDQYSVLGRTSDAITQGLGQVAAVVATGGIAGAAGLGSAGATALTTGLMGASGMGSGMSEAYKGGATDEEAATYGLIAGASDALTELIFGGLGKSVKAIGLSTGLSSADDMLAKAVSSKIKNAIAKNVVQFGVKAGAEGLEEVIAGVMQAAGKKMTYMSEEDIGKIIQDENLLEQFVVGAFTSGIAQSGVLPGTSEGSLKESIETGRDFITGFSQNEQAVIKAETEKRIAEQEVDGKKLTKNEKRAIEAQVEKDMDKGFISTDTIEETLGGETYQNYKKTIDSEDALVKQEKNLSDESKKLEGMVWEKMTGEQQVRRDELRKLLPELRSKIEDQKKNSSRDQLKSQLGKEVMSIVQGDRLVESYNERSRRGEAFKADLTKYDAKQQAVIKKAVDSGILNNTNRTHEFVDLVAKISANKGVLFDFTNNVKLKESGFALDGKTVNGFVNENGVTVNIQSAKALNTVVGHEITHVLEGTDLYTELQNAAVEYAKTKGDYQTRYDSLTKLYEGIEGANIDAELTADLVGDYLFTDSDFINKLSTENRNVFQKIFDEVKYLLKIATAGSKEARELEKVKRAFEKAYKDSALKNTADSGVKYSINEKFYDQLNNWDGKTIGFSFVVGETSQALQQAGIPKKQIRWDASKISTLLGKHDGMTLETVKQIPELLENPVIVIDSKKGNNSKIVMGDVYDSNGKVVTAVLLLTPTSKKGNVLDFFKVSSAEGRSHIKSLFTNTDGTAVPIRYVDKKRIQSWLNVNRLQLPLHNLDLDSTSSIDDMGNNVKTQFSLSDSTGRQLSAEQQEYFKDSKVRDENGSLKVMYHGTPNGDYTIFKDGTYFTDNKEYADRYQNPGASSISTGKVASNPKTFEVYLDIKKPFELNDAEARRIYIEDYIKGGNAMGINPYLSDAEYDKIKTIDWTEGEDLREFLIDNGYDYDGLVLDEGADGGYGDEVVSRGTSYVIFSPEQAKNIDNAKPTPDPDIKRSLSEENAQTPVHGSYNVYGEDVELETDDIAPVREDVAENATTPQVTAEELFPDDLASIQGELSRLQEEKTALEERLYAMSEANEFGDGFMQVSAEWDAVNKRINELEAQVDTDDADRLNSIEDADAPPEAVNEQDNVVADDVPLTKKLVDDLTRSVKSALAISNKRTAEVRDLIAEYSAKEFPSRDELYWDVADRFGTYTETQVNEELVDVKKRLRTSGINVADSIKAEIADYGQLMRSNFGKVRFSKDGLPVDVAYREFQEVLPGYFPDGIINPTDQLMHIIELANMKTTSEADYEIDSDTIWEVTDNIINSINEFKQNRREALANKESKESFKSLMQDADRYVPPVKVEDIAPIRKDLNTQSDPYDIAPTFDTSSGQQAFMPEAEVPKKVTRKELHQNIMDKIKVKFGEKGFDFDKVLQDAKDLSTFATVDNTPQRVMEKALGYKQGQVLSDLTVNQVAQNETEAIKWLNTFTDRKKGILAQISKKYGIKPGSKASAAAQMYAEGYYVIGTGKNGEYIKGKSEIVEYGDAELAKDFPDPKVRANIKGLARDPIIRKIYDDTLEAINESRARNAYPEIPRLDNYFMHFRAMEDTFSKLGLPFNPNDIRAKDLPTDLNGVTADLKPGQPYFASAKHRTGKETTFDLLGGLEKYLSSAKNQIYHIDDIQSLRALRNYIADTYGQANGLEGLDTLSEEEAQQKLHDVKNHHLSTFAKFLNEEANVLAGKTALVDRGLEGILGRRAVTFLDTLNRQVGANMVGFNVSSSLTNFLAPVQAFAKSNKFDFVKAMAQTASNKIGSIFGRGDNFADESPVIIRRKGAESFYRTPWQKVGDVGYVLMSAVDNLSTELIARTKYNELTRKGMDSKQAHIETDKWVSRLMGDRSLGQQPQLYNSKTFGLITKFQLEVRNQLDSQFYDTIQEANVSTEDIQNGLQRNAKKAAKITSTFVQLAVMQHLFGKAFESVAGYNPAFDIIEALIKVAGWDDEEEDEDTVLDNLEQGFFELMGDMPYVSVLTGGRIPIESALPFEEFWNGKDKYGNEKDRWGILGEAAPYWLLPGGYGQIKKTVQGLGMFDDDLPIAGSYTKSGNLRFPVEDTPLNRVQAGIFGQWASDNARDYFDNERSPLKEKQIEEFVDLDIPIRDYWDYREGLKDYDTLSEKADYINSLDLPIDKKNLLINNIADRKESIDMSDYDDFANFEEFDYAAKNPEKYEFLQENGISYSQYKSFDEDTKEEYDAIYNWVKDYPDKVTVSKAVTDDVVEYRQYTKALDAIRADKDKNGKSISGTAKSKKIEYINNLNLDYGAKLILFKSEYKSDDTYNSDIIEYLNGRDDISYEETVTILKELGFTVLSDGTVRW